MGGQRGLTISNVTGTLTFGDDLELGDGFTPGAGDTFDIFTSVGSLTSFFDNAAHSTRIGISGSFGSIQVLYLDSDDWNGNITSTVQLANFLPDLPGDYNNDGVVDAADYTQWRNNLGAPEGTMPNDIDGGVIGAAQYATWKANFGDALPNPAALRERRCLNRSQSCCWGWAGWRCSDGDETIQAPRLNEHDEQPENHSVIIDVCGDRRRRRCADRRRRYARHRRGVGNNQGPLQNTCWPVRSTKPTSQTPARAAR